jgi:hypothetical protein
MEFRLFLGRTVTAPCGRSVEEVYGVDPGCRQLSPHLLYPDIAPRGHPFRRGPRQSSSVILACCLMRWSGVSTRDTVRLLDAFLHDVLDPLESPWGLKSQAIRRWTVNRLDRPCSSIWGL